MSKFKSERAANLHADNFNPISIGKSSFAVGFDYDGAQYHIWFASGKPSDDFMYKNPPADLPRNHINHFDTRKLLLSNPFGLAVLAWINPQLLTLRSEARAKHEAECDAVDIEQAEFRKAQKIREAAPDLLIALRDALRCFESLEQTDAMPRDTCPADMVDEIRAAITKATTP